MRQAMSMIPAVVPPLPRAATWRRNYPPATAFQWLSAGWRDLLVQPTTSLAYGFIVFLVSIAIVVGLFALGWDYILFPAFAGFMVVGPIVAVGLYEKSRRIAGKNRSEEHTSELQSLRHLVCRLLLEKKKKTQYTST